MKQQHILKRFKGKGLTEFNIGAHDLSSAITLGYQLSTSPYSYTVIESDSNKFLVVDEDFANLDEDLNVDAIFYYSTDKNNFEKVHDMKSFISSHFDVISDNYKVTLRMESEHGKHLLHEAFKTTQERQEEVMDEVLGNFGYETDEDVEQKTDNEEKFDLDDLSKAFSDLLETIEQYEDEDVEEDYSNKAEFGYANNASSTLNDFMKYANSQNESETTGKTQTSKTQSFNTQYPETKYGYIVKDGIESDTELDSDKVNVVLAMYNDDDVKVDTDSSGVVSSVTIDELEKEVDFVNNILSLGKKMGYDKAVEIEYSYYQLDSIKDENGQLIWINKQ